jgi:hypothetical protein
VQQLLVENQLGGKKKEMKQRICNHCDRLADYSLCQILSTVRVSPRKQKCTQAIPFCSDCLRRLLTLLPPEPLNGICQPLYMAYTALAHGSRGRSDKQARS